MADAVEKGKRDGRSGDDFVEEVSIYIDHIEKKYEITYTRVRIYNFCY